MGTRKKDPAPVTLNNETNYEGAFMTPPKTEALEKVEQWEPDKQLLSAGTTASYDAARRGIVEGTGGYSGINNPVLRARMQQVGLQEVSDREASDLGDADFARNQAKLNQLQFVAGMQQPQYIQQKTYGYGQQLPQQQPSSGFWGSVVTGGASIAAAF